MYAFVCSYITIQCTASNLSIGLRVCAQKGKEKAKHTHTHISTSSVKRKKGRSITTAALYAFVYRVERKMLSFIKRKRKRERENKRGERASNVKAFASVVAQHTQTHTSFFTSKLAPR
jgi:hypothetical protein